MAFTEIDRPDLYFNTVLYTGNGSTQSISGVNFQPNFTWLKQRTGTPSSEGSQIYDVIRGATKYITSHTANAEATQSNGLTSFNSDGFSLGNASRINANGENFVSWNFLAGGTASSNTDGSITSSVSASTTSGFSIVSWTGTGSAGTIGHGLGATPVMGIFKNRTDAATNWRVWHQGITNTQILELNATSAAGVPGTADFNISNNTTDVWGLETNNQSNGSGDSMIAYIFAEKKGFSKFGSYTGNGSTDGPFIYTGFKPAFFLIKNINDGTDDWHIMDNKRNGYNPQNNILQPNLSNAEGSSTRVDFLSNGIKINSSSAFINGSGETIIYMALAENPFVTSTGVPTTAR